ncbi:MAG TPA: protein KlaA [Rhizobacter sp.]
MTVTDSTQPPTSTAVVPARLHELKTVVLPALFVDTARIGSYGGEDGGAAVLSALSAKLENSPVSLLHQQISAVIDGLNGAHPQKILRKPTWFSQLMGREIEANVRYQVSRLELEQRVKAAQQTAEAVRTLIGEIEATIAANAGQIAELRTCVQAGREYLAEHPQAGMPTEALAFDNPRERFARRVTNLAMLLQSTEAEVVQLGIARANAIGMLDRFSDTCTVLLPVWRSNIIGLLNHADLSSDKIAAATKAHDDLLNSLDRSVQPPAALH